MNFSLKTVVKVVAVASFFALVAASGVADVSAARKGGRIDFCPDGWRPVTSPLNSVLVCLPDTLVIDTGSQNAPPEGGCPEGWDQVTPPLNPVLGCLPSNIQRPSLPTMRAGKPDGLCPDGWRPATSPLNPVLGCLPTSFHMPLIPGAGSAGPIPPGSCPAGWIPATPPLNPVLLCLPGNLAPR